MKLKSPFAACLIVIAFVCMPSLLNAAPGTPGGDPDPGRVPFDGGLTLLVAAAAGYASKKAIDKRKKEKASEDNKK